MNEELMEGEEILARWNGVTLTNERVLQASGGLVNTLVLDEVDHASVERVHWPSLLAFAGLSTFSTVLLMVADERLTPLGSATAALFAIALYFATRRVELRIGAGHGLIWARSLGGPAELPAARELLDAVHEARNR